MLIGSCMGIRQSNLCRGVSRASLHAKFSLPQPPLPEEYEPMTKISIFRDYSRTFCLGARENLATCARIELTTLRTQGRLDIIHAEGVNRLARAKMCAI
jgi:hypothetical protein